MRKRARVHVTLIPLATCKMDTSKILRSIVAEVWNVAAAATVKLCLVASNSNRMSMFSKTAPPQYQKNTLATSIMSTLASVLLARTCANHGAGGSELFSRCFQANGKHISVLHQFLRSNRCMWTFLHMHWTYDNAYGRARTSNCTLATARQIPNPELHIL